MIRIRLNAEEKAHLEKMRTGGISRQSEKALMVLLSNEGLSPRKISQIIRRNAHTIRLWLKRYSQYGIAGFDRHYSPGRPPKYGAKGHDLIKAVIEDSPDQYEYQCNTWTLPLLVDYLTRNGYQMSTDTVKRTLKKLGYSYKRPSKTVPLNAPTALEKKEQIERLIEQVKEIVTNQECEIFFLDESHFSTDPYLTRGWIKKGIKKTANFFTKGQIHAIWGIRTKQFTYILEKGATR